MTLKGGTTQACAACKYQRRKCTPECLLAPYFPADQPKVFQNVHKLFGVSNIVKILKKLEPSQKKIAMDSIICQANFREKYPVHGCWEEICRLRYQIWYVEEELRAVHQQLEIHRQHYLQNQCSSLVDDVTSQLELGMVPRNNYAFPLFNHTTNQQTYNTVPPFPFSQQDSYCNSNSVPYNSIYMDSKDNVTTNPLWLQQPCEDNNSNSMAMHSQSQLVASTTTRHQQEVHEEYYDEMNPFFDTIDDRQSYIYSKEAYESSSEVSLKDTRNCINHVAENELKNAAACFSLTSVN
ncbi:LOB domain-containing protein 27-like [Senna tora]|uniref:LOB domain-containing protein 27-like n=1 Tax=Senna tora TaxID=362788 RepID=A0A834W6P2_9FABA|nr:LOB domain-containing protein 27-like [Senna tora]